MATGWKSIKLKEWVVILFVLVVITAGPVLLLMWFAFETNAPLIHGEVSYDIRYNKKHDLDIYHPTKKVYEKSPVVVYIHGGAWIAGAKIAVNNSRFNGAINNLRESGYTIISPEYTLASNGKSPFPDCIQDSYEAIQWIRRKADSLNLDMNNVGLMGESAGGHIAMVNAYASPDELDLDVRGFKPDYVVDVYGPNDLLDLYKSSLVDSIEKYVHELPQDYRNEFDLPRLLFGFDPKKDSAKTQSFAKKYSPVTYISSRNCPTLIIHGDQDILVPVRQSRKLAEMLTEKGVKNELHILAGVNHAFINANKFQKENIQTWITKFIKEQYNK